MKQIYNLLEIIEQDKLHITKLKKQLHTVESVLKAHTAALTRLTTIPELSQPKMKKVDYSPAVEVRERITLDNWRALNIKEGDEVEIVVSGDPEFEDNSKHVVTWVEHSYSKCSGVHLGVTWYGYNDNEKGCDELYLIRTEEGSNG